MWDRARAECPESIWLAVEDIGPLVSFVEQPYPEDWRDAAGSHVIYGYGCNRTDAQNVVERYK